MSTDPEVPGVRPFLHGPAPEGPPETGPDAAAVLRPFVITSGRTAAADPSIGLETQVSTLPGVSPARLSPERRAIVQLCHEPLSVAEISARLRLHFGVARILVGDLRATGHLDVHVMDDEFPDPDTILRVISGLRALS
ncbi:DUF742 domain-containing protein [Actinoplanes sp. RD1]|uniref:DUF742 domain-containing protein n=1 Tax=Actinoplanes sp. RD1 TaxID=3064538 RepID=UPI002740CA8A|nr:DUF742 domain-containing protein [Actinoplanes sp. RD1]